MSDERKVNRETPLWFTHKLANRARKVSGVRVGKIDRMTKGLAVYAAILTTILTTFTFIEKVVPKQHRIEVYVSDYYVGSEFVEFTVAYYNIGDYSEVLSNVSLFLAQEIEGFSVPSYFEQASCRTPALIEKGKTVYKQYRAKINYQDPNLNLFSGQKARYQLMLHFDFLSKENGRAFSRFPVANATPNRGKLSVNFLTMKKEIDFSNARSVEIIATYPIDKEYEKPSFCGKEI